MKPQPEVSGDKEELRIKVAELCPDLFEIHQTWRGPEGSGHRTFLVRKKEGISGDEVDPLTDLNACAEFEEVLKEKGLCVEYVNMLRDGAIAPGTLSRYGLVHATAEQRCRAFISTMEGTK